MIYTCQTGEYEIMAFDYLLASGIMYVEHCPPPWSQRHGWTFYTRILLETRTTVRIGNYHEDSCDTAIDKVKLSERSVITHASRLTNISAEISGQV